MKYILLRQPFSLKHTLESGQFFRWQKNNDGYYAQTKDLVLKLEQKDNKLYYAASAKTSPAFVNAFLGLDHDLEKIYKHIATDRIMLQALKAFRGMRIMKQDPFECLISYICSANSNIPNIRCMAENLSKKFGKKIKFDGRVFYSFPTPKALASAEEKELRVCKVGFRAGFISAAAKLAAQNKINWSREGLMNIHGVGPKIADCVRLYGLGDFSAFPIDVWMRRAMKNYYGCSEKNAQDFATQKWAGRAGYAQLYLFNLIRQKE